MSIKGVQSAVDRWLPAIRRQPFARALRFVRCQHPVEIGTPRPDLWQRLHLPGVVESRRSRTQHLAHRVPRHLQRPDDLRCEACLPYPSARRNASVNDISSLAASARSRVVCSTLNRTITGLSSSGVRRDPEPGGRPRGLANGGGGNSPRARSDAISFAGIDPGSCNASHCVPVCSPADRLCHCSRPPGSHF